MRPSRSRCSSSPEGGDRPVLHGRDSCLGRGLPTAPGPDAALRKSQLPQPLLTPESAAWAPATARREFSRWDRGLPSPAEGGDGGRLMLAPGHAGRSDARCGSPPQFRAARLPGIVEGSDGWRPRQEAIGWALGSSRPGLARQARLHTSLPVPGGGRRDGGSAYPPREIHHPSQDLPAKHAGEANWPARRHATDEARVPGSRRQRITWTWFPSPHCRG